MVVVVDVVLEIRPFEVEKLPGFGDMTLGRRENRGRTHFCC